jgi:glycosyltransferase involved in cell wall biosynthesis
VIIPTRDGEAHLETTITSLLNQDVRVAITVVDDFSLDGTREILADFPQIVVIRNPMREPKRHERIGKLLNLGRGLMPPARFYMISGDDTRFPKDYIRRVTDSMILDRVSCASGHAREYVKTGAPDGSGRIYTAELWDHLMPFLESSGWESGMMLRARFDGYQLKKYPVKKEHLRPYSQASQRNDGYGSWTLGNPLIWTVLRVIKILWRKQRSPRGALALLGGHVEYMIKGKPRVEFWREVRADKLKNLSKRLRNKVRRVIGFLMRGGRAR